MPLIRIILISIAAFQFVSCTKLRNTWKKEGYTGNTFSKIAIIGVSKSLEDRKSFEEQAVAHLSDLDIELVMGVDIFPPKESISDSLIQQIISTNQIDAIITISLVSSELHSIDENLVRFSQFYIRRFNHVQALSILLPSERVVMEGVLYDLVDGDNLVWKGEMALLDPDKNVVGKQRFIKRMMNQLIDEKIIRGADNILVDLYQAGS